MLQLNNGSPRLGNDAIVSMALRNTNENPVPFASGDVRSERITRDHPISRIRFVLRGDLNVSSTVTLHSLGLLNLIQKLRVSRNGNQDVLNVPGKVLPEMHIMATQMDHYEVLPTLTAGTTGFVAAVEVGFDAGSYLSLLDATGDQSLDVEATWGDVNDVIASGAATLENVKLDVIPMVVTGALPGERGGAGAAYFRPHAIYNEKPVTQAQPDFQFDLTAQRGYHGLTLFAYEDGAKADTLINSVTLERVNANNLRLEWDEVRAFNKDRYRLASGEFVGVYDLPFVDPGHLEHTLSIRNSQSMKLVIDTEHPGTTDTIGLLQSYFRNPSQG